MKRIRVKKVFGFLFTKRSVAYRRGYIHFYHDKFPNIKDNPYNENKKEFNEWRNGFYQSINDIVIDTKKYER